ncbi:RING/U-box superfamily protein [Melia azedarach]|uniref:RING/U-box superfamily protein n=1 Tax=Melia azedarach TaxID=155640 RepID=A0ACC1XY21_MELAZ|nr:RING/U-box superfamily protein [Melia azedarach]
MTSASELFYTRRSRVGRAEPDLGLDSFTPERSFHNRRHNHHNHNHRHDLGGCDPLRRSPHVRHSTHRSSHSERTPVQLDQITSQNVVINPINTEISRSTNRPSLNGNERLPGAVLLARARLLERLRGSVSFWKRSARASSNIYRRGSIFSDELRLVDAGDWGAETSAGWTAGNSPFAELLNSQTERLQLMHEGKKHKPPGLTQEDLDCLHFEVFNGFQIGAEREASNASFDCSICLESFVDGDELIRLPCEHRFHSTCLDPWVRSCGDCPYCRRDIVCK